jgi:RNA polymerase sigma-70 factor (ECF subfamily)
MSRSGNTNGETYRSAELKDSDVTSFMCEINDENDRAVFRLIVAYAAPRLKSMLLRQGVSDRSAENIVHESVLTSCRRDNGLLFSRSDLLTAIYQAARTVRMHESVNRDIASLHVLQPAPPDRSSEPACSTGTLRRAAASKALKDLPLEQRAIVELLFVEAISPEQIAARLGVPATIIKSHMRHACRNICAAYDVPGSASALVD